MVISAFVVGSRLVLTSVCGLARLEAAERPSRKREAALHQTGDEIRQFACKVESSGTPFLGKRPPAWRINNGQDPDDDWLSSRIDGGCHVGARLADRSAIRPTRMHHDGAGRCCELHLISHRLRAFHSAANRSRFRWRYLARRTAVSPRMIIQQAVLAPKISAMRQSFRVSRA